MSAIDEFARRLRHQTLTARAATDACLARIDADDRRVNAFIRVLADQARRDADAADQELAAGIDRGPLHGLPISIKDLVDMRGVPTTAASRVREGHVAAADAPIVERLRAAGAVLIGKTNLHEFAYGTTSDDSAFGAVRNPIDPARSPGGSSGGSAVSVAAGMAVASIGTDTGGSIRIPAAACGVVGLKPTYGELPVDAIVPLSRSLDHVGPLTQTVGDARIVYRALQGKTGDALSASRPLSLQGRTLVLLRGYMGERVHPDVRARIDASLAALQAAGATVVEAAIAHASSTPAVYMHIHAAEGAAYHARMVAEAPERYSATVRGRLLMGQYILAADYLRALELRDALRGEVDAALAGADAIVTPTLPIPAPIIGEEFMEIDGVREPVRALMLRFTQLFNLTGHPALSLPCGTTPAGLPCGLQIVGRRFETDALLDIAQACEQALGPVTSRLETQGAKLGS